MSRPNTSNSILDELPAGARKYEGLNHFMAERPPELAREVLEEAFHQIDTNKDVSEERGARSSRSGLCFHIVKG